MFWPVFWQRGTSCWKMLAKFSVKTFLTFLFLLPHPLQIVRRVAQASTTPFPPQGWKWNVLGRILLSYLCTKLRRQLLRQHSIYHIINLLWWIGRISYNHLITDHCVFWSLKMNDGCRHFCVFHITFLRQDSIFSLLSKAAEDVSSRGRGVEGGKELKRSNSSVPVFLISPGTWSNTFRHICSMFEGRRKRNIDR